eukprot:663902-Prorocentrum_lima.AAC.1
MEADLNPRDWLKGSACNDCNPYVDVKATRYANTCIHAVIPTTKGSLTTSSNCAVEPHKYQ